MSLYEAPFKCRAKVEKNPITSCVQTRMYLVARLILRNLAQPSPSSRSCFYLRVKYFYAIGTDQRCVAVLSPDSCFVRASVYLTGVAALQGKVLAERSIHGAQPLPAHCVPRGQAKAHVLCTNQLFSPMTRHCRTRQLHRGRLRAERSFGTSGHGARSRGRRVRLFAGVPRQGPGR